MANDITADPTNDCPLTMVIIHETYHEKSDWSRAYKQYTIAYKVYMIMYHLQLIFSTTMLRSKSA